MKNRLLFTSLYLIGMALVVTLFILFVPQEARTDTKWLNLFVGLVIYTGLWGKYSLFYTTFGSFSGRTPAVAMYWMGFFAYAAAAVALMLICWACGAGFGKQVIFHLCLIFGFIVWVASGLGATNFINAENSRIEQDVGGIRAVQNRAGQLKILLETSPAATTLLKSEFDAVVDAATYTGGSSNPQAREYEGKVLMLLDKLETQLPSASTDECLATVKSIAATLALRKTVKN